MGLFACICLIFIKAAFCIVVSYRNSDFNFIFGIVSIYYTPYMNFTATLTLYCLCFNFICMILITIFMYLITIIPSPIFDTTFALMITSWILNVFMYCLSAYCLLRVDCVDYSSDASTQHKNSRVSLNDHDDTTRREYQFFTHMCSPVELLADRTISLYLLGEKRIHHIRKKTTLLLTGDANNTDDGVLSMRVFTHVVGDDLNHCRNLWDKIFADVQHIVIENALTKAGLID
eukprot:925642_1